MSARIRGQEATVRITVDGQVQRGSFFKVTDFEVTPRTDLTEEGYLGETEDDIDIQHHGFDFSFSVDNEDEGPLEFLSDIVEREADRQAHPSITVLVIYAYRKQGARNKVEVYHDCFMKLATQGFGGRKEYVKTSFEGKSKRRSLMNA